MISFSSSGSKTNVKPISRCSFSWSSHFRFSRFLPLPSVFVTTVLLFFFCPSFFFMRTLNYCLTKTTNPSSLFVVEFFFSSFIFTMIINVYNVAEKESNTHTSVSSDSDLENGDTFPFLSDLFEWKSFSACPIEDESNRRPSSIVIRFSFNQLHLRRIGFASKSISLLRSVWDRFNRRQERRSCSRCWRHVRWKQM